jgi:hypothetical protein
MCLQVAVWLVAHPRQFGNWWTGQRPSLQDISGGANFVNKADNGIVVHRDWTRLKELRERAAAASGKAPTEGGRGNGRGKGKAGDKGTEGGAVEEVDPLEELKVLVFIDKVGTTTLGGMRVDPVAATEQRGQQTCLCKRLVRDFPGCGPAGGRAYCCLQALAVRASVLLFSKGRYW